MVESSFMCSSSSLNPCLTSALFILITSPSNIFLRNLIFSVQRTTRISPVSSDIIILASLPSLPFLLVNFFTLEMCKTLPVTLMLSLPVSNSVILCASFASDNGLFSSLMYSPTIVRAISSSLMKLTSS